MVGHPFPSLQQEASTNTTQTIRATIANATEVELSRKERKRRRRAQEQIDAEVDEEMERLKQMSKIDAAAIRANKKEVLFVMKYCIFDAVMPQHRISASVSADRWLVCLLRSRDLLADESYILLHSGTWFS